MTHAVPMLSRDNYRAMARQLLPGLVLPGLVYWIVSRHTSTMPALSAASLVPAVDILTRLVRGKRPTFVSVAFLALTGTSIVLATALHAPWFITGRGAALSAVFGIALVLSGFMGRPLTKTLAVRLCSTDAEQRERLAASWSRPKTVAVFRTLALGWGLWLLASAIQQGAMVIAVSPGVFMAVEPPLRAALTGIGILASIAYVRRCQTADPELALLP